MSLYSDCSIQTSTHRQRAESVCSDGAGLAWVRGKKYKGSQKVSGHDGYVMVSPGYTCQNLDLRCAFYCMSIIPIMLLKIIKPRNNAYYREASKILDQI